MKTTDFDNIASYKTAMVAACHLKADVWANLIKTAREDAPYFIHATDKADDAGLIIRITAVCADDGYEDFEAALEQYSTDPDLLDLLYSASTNGFDAVHFDRDADLLAQAPWYMDDGTRVKPLAYDVPIMDVNDLNHGQVAFAVQEWSEDESGLDDVKFLVIEGSLYRLDDFMRLDNQEYGFHAAYGEGFFTSLYISLNDDQESVNVVRVGGK